MTQLRKLLLTKVKGNLSALGSPEQKQEAIQQGRDSILRPVMELLEDNLTVFADTCEKTVLKRLLKALWIRVITQLEKTIVLPPISHSRRVRD